MVRKQVPERSELFLSQRGTSDIKRVVMLPLLKRINRMKIIKRAVVLHNGWEMDNWAWVKKDESGELHLLTTSHGSEYKMTKDELLRKIKETRDSLDQLNGLLGLVT
jgi:hypothetical protein